MMPNNSTNKTNAALRRLSSFGDVLITHLPSGTWEVRVYLDTASPGTKEASGFSQSKTLDAALNECLRKMEDAP